MTSAIAMIFMLPFMLLGAAFGLIHVGFVSGWLSMTNYIGLTALRKRKARESHKRAMEIMKEKP